VRVGGSAALGLFLLLLVAPRSGAQELQVGDATLRLAGWIHAGFITTSVERWNGGFALRRARVTLDGRLSDFVDGRLQVDVHGGEATLQDAFVRLSFDPAFRLSLGQFKRAFDSFVLDSPADVSFVELDGRIPGLATGCARAGDLCTPGALTTGLSLAFRDMGVRVEGGGGRLSWLATLTNGTGLNQRDENDAKSASGRLEWRVASRLRLGGQVALHDHPGAVADRNEAEYAGAWGLDARWGGDGR